MRHDDSNQLLKAALLWDTRTLLHSKNSSARAFFDALTGASIHNQDELEDGSVLGAGAKAIVAALQDDSDLARTLLQGSSRERQWIRLFRLFLRGWLFPDETTTLLDPLASEVGRVRERKVRAHLYAKLAGLALDVGDRSRAHDYIRIAREVSPTSTPLGFQLQLTEANLFRVMPETFETPARTDDLVEYPWIRARALASAKRALSEYVESQATSPWSTTFRFGLSSADEAVLAEMQASWAGALWLRSELRTLAGSLLLSAGRQPTDVAYGAALWIRGGGKNIREVIDSAERRFDKGTANAIFEHLRGFGASPSELDRLAEVVSATWDLISESLAAELLERLQPRAGDHPTLAMVRQSWAALSLRVPKEWEAMYRQLPIEDRNALITSITPDLATLLPVEVAEELWAFVRTDIGASLGVPGWLLFGALLRRFGTDADKTLVSLAPPEAVAQLAYHFPDLVAQKEVSRSIASLASQVKRETEEAIDGTMQLSVLSPRGLLGQAMFARSRLDTKALSVLKNSAVDSRVPADYRVESLRALTLVGGRHALPSLVIEEVIRDRGGAPGHFDEVPIDLLNALRLAVLATTGKANASSADLVLASRSRDARVRQVAVEAADIAHQRGRSMDFEYVITSGLFDPQEQVVIAALGALRHRSGWRRQTLKTVAARLAEMFVSYGRQVRANLIWATAKSGAVGASAEGRYLLRAGLEDRSWIVRDTAKRANAETSSPKKKPG